VRAVVHHVTAEGDGIEIRLALEHRFQGGPVAMDVGEDEELH
jgi:hypothetical protein